MFLTFLIILSLQIGSFNCLTTTDPLDIVSKDCKITEPVYNYTFDLSLLHSDLAHTNVSERSDTFNFNLCGPINKKCNGKSNVTACIKRGDKEYVIGTEHELKYKNGKIFFEFNNGEKCKDDKPYKLFVTIGCDYTIDKYQLSVTPYAQDQCSFYITFETIYGCLPLPTNVESNTCSVSDPQNGYTYNLLPLSDSNYRTIGHNNSAFIINVCKPVLYGQNTMCPIGSSICLLDLNANDYKTKFFDYGKVEAAPTIENGQLVMKHLSDIPCNSSMNYTSTISFYCEIDMKFGTPDFMGLKGCNYNFAWYTSFACNQASPCLTTDPNSGFVYDLTSLSNKKQDLALNDKKFTIGICSDASSTCQENVGACEIIKTQSNSLGLANSNLHFNSTGAPFLLYENGAKCDKNSFWTTKIEFFCSQNLTSEPKIIEYSDCQLLVHYPTKLTCHEQITCKAKGYAFDDDQHDEIDLTPLISISDNYVAKIKDSVQIKNKNTTKIFLNVCRPLVPTFGLGCPGGSAACLTEMGPTTPEKEKSLGYPDISLTMTNKSRAELKYLGGSSCPEDPSSQLTSSIEFYCDFKVGKGTPILSSILNKCHYEFIWPTNVICPTHLCEFSNSTCEIINKELNEKFNIKSAKFTDKGVITIKGHTSESFPIDVCGSDRRALTDYSQGVVKVFFKSKGPCGMDGIINVQLRIICSKFQNSTVFSDSDLCSLTYTQYTPDICKFLGSEDSTTMKPSVKPSEKPSEKPEEKPVEKPAEKPTDKPTETTTVKTEISTSTVISTTLKGKNEDTSKPSSAGNSTATIMSIVLVTLCAVVLFAVFRNPVRRERFTRLLRSRLSSVRYSRVETNEEANLLLDHNGHFTDSDDDMLL